MLLTPDDDMKFAPIGPCVYLIQCHHFYKIGFASDVLNRLTCLQVGCPYPLTLLYVYYHHAARRIERDMHKEYAVYAHAGEWFTLPNPSMIAWPSEWQPDATIDYARKAGTPPKWTPYDTYLEYGHYYGNINVAPIPDDPNLRRHPDMRKSFEI